ncbi:mechanosensitive ion channel family protein [Candidatus Saccharibacteria bacterium TM7i]|nr:mechanosensitive ion channel family protein [Candidatus Saccharibacteria bacterium TM7i]
MDTFFEDISRETSEFFAQPTAYRSVLILIATIIGAYIASRFLAKAIVFLAQRVAVRSEAVSDEAKSIRLRQVETYLSITVAIVRAAVVAVAAYVAWRLISPVSSSGAAAIGASAFFIVFAGQTLGMVLRDLTAGVIMITEGWFHVGDYIKIEPFIDVTGVVERFTLRSTKIRSLSGEVVWVHNQQIQAVHVTPNGVRTLAVDLFTRDIETAKAVVEDIIATLPVGASLLPKPVKIKKIEEWGNGMSRIVVTGQTAPGREWLIEKYFVDAIKEVDEDKKDKSSHVFIYDPIARYADPVADRKFKRAIRVKRES